MRNQSIIDRIISMSGKNEKICIFDLVKGNTCMIKNCWELLIIENHKKTILDSLAEAMHVVVKRIHQINLKQKLKVSVYFGVNENNPID